MKTKNPGFLARNKNIFLIALVAQGFQAAVQLVMLNGFFIILWAGAAWLFRRAEAV